MSDTELFAETGQESQGSFPELLGFSSVEVIQAMQQDMDFFGGVVLPDDCTYRFPAFYLWVWSQLTSIVNLERDFTKMAIGLPRGHGKTQVVKLFIVFVILFSKKRYILVIGANKDKAVSIISDVIAMLDGDNIQELFGNWRFDCETDTQEKKVFTFQGRKIILEAAGTGTAIRGSNRGQARPDLMVFDDAQTKECAESIQESKNFQKWFVGTALKAKSPKGCTFIYIGNMYKDLELIPNSGKYCCMLRMLQKSKSWISFIVGAINSAGQALWEELQPLHQLLSEYKSDCELGEEDIFFAEVLNNPTGGKSYYFDPEKVVCMRNCGEFPHQGNFIIIDPATSKGTKDQMTIQYYEIYDNRPVCREILADKFTGPQSVQAGIGLAFKWNCPLIIVEDNAYQHTLCQWFEFILQQQQITGLTIQPMTSRENKIGKILKSFKSWMSDEIRTTPETHSQITHQATVFDPTKTDNLDDIIDNCAMAHQAALIYRPLMTVQGDLSMIHATNVIDQNSVAMYLPHTNF